MKQKKQFFFEKKNQKTFISAPAQMPGLSDPVVLAPGTKVFWFFFSKKNCFLLVVFLLALHAANAETVTPPNVPPPDSWEPRQSGIVRVLNKLDSTVQTLTLHVGETAKLQSLSITLQGCDVRPAGLPEDATAHLSVADSREGQPGFDGWILAKEPAVNMLEHPVYDIQLAGCH